MKEVNLHLGNCLDVLKTLPDNSIDSIVTDPPYGLGKEPNPAEVMQAWVEKGYHEIKGKGFMGKEWDAFVPQPIIWKEVLRVLKPGGHILCFAGTRTQDWMAMSLRFAGFEVRDVIMWVYGSGFPKSHNISKAIDKEAGAEREQVPATGSLHKNRNLNDDGWSKIGDDNATMSSNEAVTPEAKQWQGWGTALKPALEPITVARKPLIGTVAQNVLQYGTGAINIDGCRVETDDLSGKIYNNKGDALSWGGTYGKGVVHGNVIGRWPANLIHDDSDEVTNLFPGTEDKSASRFFYCAKASKKDRNDGLENFEVKLTSDGSSTGLSSGMPEKAMAAQQNHHPTVKPIDLMRYLCRLVTSPNGTVLDPFMGSGSTGKAAVLEGFNFTGIEMQPEYLDIAKARIDAVNK